MKALCAVLLDDDVPTRRPCVRSENDASLWDQRAAAEGS